MASTEVRPMQRRVSPPRCSPVTKFTFVKATQTEGKYFHNVDKCVSVTVGKVKKLRDFRKATDMIHWVTVNLTGLALLGLFFVTFFQRIGTWNS